MTSWLVLKNPHKPIDIVDADSPESACIRVAQKNKQPGRYMAVEWNPVICKVDRDVSESWEVRP